MPTRLSQRFQRAGTFLMSACLLTSTSLAQTPGPAPAPGASAPAPATTAPPAATAPPAPPPPPAPAGAKPLAESLTGAAKEEYDAGRLAFSAGDFATASVKFGAAHEHSNDARLLFNMAVCARRLNKWSRVLVYLQRYKKEGGVLLSDQDRKDADELIGAVKPFVSPLKLTVDPPGAKVFLDDEQVGVSPLEEPVLVDAGQRRIRVSKQGYQDFQRVEDAPGGKEIAAAITLKPAKGRLAIGAAATDSIAVDGNVVGVGRWEGELPSGSHSVRVTGKGMRPQNQEIVVKDDETRRLDITLTSDASTPLWMYVGGGVLAAAAIGGGAYLLLRDDKKETSPPVPGTLGTFTLPLLR